MSIDAAIYVAMVHNFAGSKMNLSVTIRPATVADVSGIARVHVESWRTTYAGIVPSEYLAGLSTDVRWPLREGMLTHTEFGHTRFTFVAERDGEIVGFTDGGPARNCEICDGEIFAIYLLVEHQGRGHGRGLLRALAERMVDAGFRSAIVGVLAANPARGFYEKLGARYIHSEEITIAGTLLEEQIYAWSDLRTLL